MDEVVALFSSPSLFGGTFGVLWFLFAMTRGITRQLVGFVCLGIGFLSGVLMFRLSPSLLGWLFNPMPTTAMAASSVVVAIVAYITTKRVLRYVYEASGPAKTQLGRWSQGGISLVPCLLLLTAAAVTIRWAGAIRMMASVNDAVRNPRERADWKPPYFTRLMENVARGSLGKWSHDLDPLKSRNAAALGSLLLTAQDPRMFQKLLESPDTGNILRHPDVALFLRSEEWKKSASYGTYGRVMTLPGFRRLIKHEHIKPALESLNVQEAIQNAWIPKARRVY